MLQIYTVDQPDLCDKETQYISTTVNERHSSFLSFYLLIMRATQTKQNRPHME